MRMRPSCLAAALTAVMFCLAATGPAAPQANPFGQGAEERQRPGSPVREQELAEGEGNERPASPGPFIGERRPDTPFDINEDGRAQVPDVVVEDPVPSRASTTTSPLGVGRRDAAVVPVDEFDAARRDDLNALILEDETTLRELRVSLSDDDWVEAMVDRPIVPFRTLRLDGEIDRQSWSVYLSPAEAARGGMLTLAFTNSVLVLPEASRLSVYLNGVRIAETAIDTPERTKVIAIPASADLLRPGQNAVRIETQMRHRIDCSHDATYELWTRIDPRLTGLTFTDGRVLLSTLEDLSSVGVGPNGATRIRVIQRDPSSALDVERLVRAVQVAAIRGHIEQPLVEVLRDPIDTSELPEPGTLTIVIGTYEDIRPLAPTVPPEGASRPINTLIDTKETGPVVFITGPDQRSVDVAADRFADIPPPAPSVFADDPLVDPDPSPLIGGGNTVSIREAGVRTTEFSGRRFRTEFSISLPPDFFAAEYGEARLLLDAAYSPTVEQGSQLTVLVNGVPSTAIRFQSADGELFDDFPIVLVMESFRPGRNTIEITADLETDADQACLPGGTVPSGDRFALFNSTRLVFPDYARIGQLPNLRAFAESGFPYSVEPGPLRLRVGGSDLDTIGATGTLMARIAASRGVVLPAELVDAVAPFGDAGVLVVAPLPSISDLALEVTGADDVVPRRWFDLRDDVDEPAGLERYDQVLRRLRSQIREDEISSNRAAVPRDGGGQAAADPNADRFQRWSDAQDDGGMVAFLSKTARGVRSVVGLSEDGDRNVDPAARVGGDISLIMAQATAPENDSTAWTLVTAPNGGLLSASVAAITSEGEWAKIAGRLTTYSPQNAAVTIIPADNLSYLGTIRLSFTNVRLIAANWFSLNNGIYTLGLMLGAALLGWLTWLVLHPLGRRD